MKELSRRQWMARGLAFGAAGTAGLAATAALAKHYELLPPDGAGLCGPGETLTYAAHRLLGGRSLAREFSRSQISAKPFANGAPPKDPAYLALQADGFAGWHLVVGGAVGRPASFSLAQLKSLEHRSHITHLACEEGWSYIAEWIGVPLSTILHAIEPSPSARYVVYRSIQPGWWDSLDMNEALHPQTLLAYGMNSGDLPAPFGGPLRMRVPRQLGYKSVKYITSLTVTDSLKQFGKGLGSAAPEAGYAWYAGI